MIDGSRNLNRVAIEDEVFVNFHINNRCPIILAAPTAFACVGFGDRCDSSSYSWRLHDIQEQLIDLTFFVVSWMVHDGFETVPDITIFTIIKRA